MSENNASSGPATGGYSGFLGDSVDLSSDQATSSGPASDESLGSIDDATATDETVEAPETSTESELEQDASADETESVEGDDQDSEASSGEDRKLFDDELKDAWARQRYGRLYQRVLQNPDDRDLLEIFKGKVEGDFTLRNLKNAPPEESIEEPALEDEPVEAPVVSPEDQEKQFQQHLTTIDKWAEQRTDPRVAAKAYDEFMSIWAQDDKGNAKLSPEQQKAAFGRVMTKWTANVAATAIPDILFATNPQTGMSMIDQYLDQAYPGFRDNWEKSQWETAWNAVVSSDPQYSTLPKYGTPQFKQWAEENIKKFPEVREAQFKGTLQQQAQKRYTMLVRLATGQKVTPAIAKQAAETAKKQAAEAQNRRQLGKALGSGQSTKNFGKPKGGDSDLDSAIAEFRKNSTPFNV